MMNEILRALRLTLGSLLSKLPRALFLAVFIPWALGYLAVLAWPFELASHFKLQHLIAGLLFLPVFAALRQWRWLAAALLCVAINGAHVLPWYWGARAAGPAGERVRLLLWNICIENVQYGAVAELVRAESPDLIFAQEVTPVWAAELAALRAAYPHGLVRASDDALEGMALLSRRPLLALDDTHLNDFNGPSLEVSLSLGARPLHIITNHPPPPLGRLNSARRNAQFARIAARMRALPASKVVIGDFNCTMWSPYFARLREQSGLNDARRGFGLLPSWWDFSPLLRLPLDHCLVSPDIRVVNLRIGPDLGSDHLPLIVDLELPASSAER